MRVPRWYTNRLIYNRDNEILQLVQVYAHGENKELVKQENRNVKHKRNLLIVNV